MICNKQIVLGAFFYLKKGSSSVAAPVCFSVINS